MTLLRYSDAKLGEEKLRLISVCAEVIEEHRTQGLTMTLRQLYYQLVARDAIPNNKTEYDRLKNAIGDGRMAGLISWTSIEDRTRFLQGTPTTDGVNAAMKAARSSYARDLWEDQPIRPEVWVEKDAQAGIVEGPCSELRVDFFSCRGYASASSVWRAGQRFAGYVRKGQRPVVLYLGDHDPSGIDMTRDVTERLALFAGVPIQVVRLGLNWDQIQKFNPPPNPVKFSDSRADGYISKFGRECWEMDALRPRTTRDLIEDAVLRLRDARRWDDALAREAEEKALLDQIAEDYR